MILALVIFAVTYLLMLALPKERPWVALCSAAVFMALGQLGVYDFSLSAALGAVDYNVLLMTPAKSASTHTAHWALGTRTISCSARRAGIRLRMNSDTIPMVPDIISSTL